MTEPTIAGPPVLPDTTVEGPAGARATRPRGRRVPGAWLPVAVLLAALTLLVVIPLLALFGAALENGLGGMWEAVASAWTSIWTSLWSSLGATILAVLAGGAIAFLTERTDVPGRRALRLAMLVAFIVPGYVAAVAWLDAYAPGGLVDDILGIAAPALVGPLGVIMVLAAEAAPITYLVIAAGLVARAEPDLERAARVSGADALTTLRTVTLPLLRPFVAAAAVLAFVLSVTSFGVPAVLGVPAGLTTITTRIYRDLTFSADPESFVRAIGLAITLAVATALLIWVADGLLERRRTEPSGVFGGPLGNGAMASGRRVGGPVPSRFRNRVALAGVVAWMGVGFVVVVPLVALLLTALARAPGLPPVPASWTLENFRAVSGSSTLGALGNSILLAGAAAVGVMALAAAAVSARRGRGGGLVGGALAATFALPGSTLAVAVLLAYGVALRDTLLIILVAYLAKLWAIGYRPLAAGLDGLAADLSWAARVSGADGPTTMRTIVLPLLRPMVVAGGLIVFMFGLHEVTMSSLLYGPGTATLGVVVLNLQQLGAAGQTAALAVLLTLLVALASLPLLGRSGLLERVGWRR